MPALIASFTASMLGTGREPCKQAAGLLRAVPLCILKPVSQHKAMAKWSTQAPLYAALLSVYVATKVFATAVMGHGLASVTDTTASDDTVRACCTLHPVLPDNTIISCVMTEPCYIHYLYL
jgi:hypothetical protein